MGGWDKRKINDTKDKKLTFGGFKYMVYIVLFCFCFCFFPFFIRRGLRFKANKSKKNK